MNREAFAAVVATALTGGALLLVSGNRAAEGPVLLSLWGGHGVHMGDLPVVALWLVAMAALLAVKRRRSSGPTASSAPPDAAGAPSGQQSQPGGVAPPDAAHRHLASPGSPSEAEGHQ